MSESALLGNNQAGAQVIYLL